VKKTDMTDTNDQLLSAGTVADSAPIQIFETLAVVGAAAVLGLSIVDAFALATTAAVIALLSLGGAYLLRRNRVLRNEAEARDARAARYTFPPERADTINSITAPDDLKRAAVALIIGGQHLSRLEISARLSSRIGQTRATEYLPLILQYGDRDVEENFVPR
jgi:hypothetical protein